MTEITKAEAYERFANNLEVYRLYDDGSEALVEEIEDIDNEYFGDYDFGYEK